MIRENQRGRGEPLGSGRVAFLQHGNHDIPGSLEARARQLGLATVVHRSDQGREALPPRNSFDLLVVMGSAASVSDDSIGWIGHERRLVADAVDRATPVLGVCFGGQLLAQVLGAEVRRLPVPEMGWRRLHSADPIRIPPGPWLVWHEDEFTAPPGADIVARTDVSLHAFVDGVHTGVQFHPEVDAGTVGSWIDDARAEESLDPAAARELLAGFDPHGRGPEDQVRLLFDGFLERGGFAL